jgi:hypothetical protein
MKKQVRTLTGIVLALICAFSLAACGGNDSGGETDGDGTTEAGGVKTYVMEAEYTDLDGKIGAGLSNEASGVQLICGDGTAEQKALGWSNGYFIWCTYSTDLQFDFVFNSDKAETAQIILRLGSELGTSITLNPENFAVKLNGTAISYGNTLITSSPISSLVFADKTVTANAALLAGENTVSLTVLQNNLMGGQTGGPMIDCVKIKTKAALTWTDKTDNPGRRGEI